MNFTDAKIVEIYYMVDEFCKEFEPALSKKIIGNPSKRKPMLSNSEVITIMILFDW